jgi:hypothetical protein
MENKKPTYTILRQRLKQVKSDYRFMSRKEVRCFPVEEQLLKEIINIGDELKEIDKTLSNTYKTCLNGGYYPNYSIHRYKLLSTSLILKGVISISIIILVFNI